MTLSDGVLDHLREAAVEPDLSETKYRLIRRLGRGGMSDVFEAEDTVLRRRVALKVVSIAAGEDGDGRVAAEALLTAGLEHPGLVPVHDSGKLPDGRTYYAMKLVVGRRLDELDRRDLAIAERLRVFLRICETSAFAHARGILHRDLKPANVMVGSFGEVLVLDWGLAGHSDRREPTEAGKALGTPGYWAPEQERGEIATVTERSDVYGLGGILHFLLTGRPPADSTGNRPPEVPLSVWAICRTALERDPGRRYSSVEALSGDVQRFLDGAIPTVHSPGYAERIGRFVSRNRVVMALVAAYLVLRVVLLILFSTPGR